MIPLALQTTLRDLFARSLKDPVKIDFFTQKPLPLTIPGREECATCPPTGEMLADLARLHPALRLTVHERGADLTLEQKLSIEHVPAIVLRGVLNRPATFYGQPARYLFEPFIEGIVLMSRNESGLPRELASRLKRLRESVRVQLFVDADSPPCTPMVQTAYALAVESKWVKVTIYAVPEYPRLAERYAIRTVPTVIFNGLSTFTGLVAPNVFVDHLLKAAAARTAIPLPRGEAATPLRHPAEQGQAPTETVRPSGLIIPRG